MLKKDCATGYDTYIPRSWSASCVTDSTESLRSYANFIETRPRLVFLHVVVDTHRRTSVITIVVSTTTEDAPPPSQPHTGALSPHFECVSLILRSLLLLDGPRIVNRRANLVPFWREHEK
jgi:hypothetical protein